jgi:hypothetical protein
LVNTTTQGMVGQPALEISLAALPVSAVVCDIVYNPLVPPLLAAAAARGNPVVGGLGMLLHQARPAFAAWFGVMPEVTPALRAKIEATIAPSTARGATIAPSTARGATIAPSTARGATIAPSTARGATIGPK